MTSDFHFIYLNELYNVVQHSDMKSLRLVTHAEFIDSKDLLITAGKDGVFIFKFAYFGNYKPELAAKVDILGAHISISLKD